STSPRQSTSTSGGGGGIATVTIFGPCAASVAAAQACVRDTVPCGATPSDCSARNTAFACPAMQMCTCPCSPPADGFCAVGASAARQETAAPAPVGGEEVQPSDTYSTLQYIFSGLAVAFAWLAVVFSSLVLLIHALSRPRSRELKRPPAVTVLSGILYALAGL